MKPNEIETRIAELDAWIRTNQPKALNAFCEMTGEICSVHVMHAHIGRNNNTFVDSIRTQFTGPDDFIAKWIVGLQAALADRAAKGKLTYGDKKSSDAIVFDALQNDILRGYTFKFLERNFYRNFRARIRAKPGDDLWNIWFGSGDLVWGLAISPAYRNAEWTNDKSQMRRENYQYWTLRHVLDTGLIDPTSETPLKFQTIDDFTAFYRSVLKRVSNSNYEKGISDRYLAYLAQSKAPLDEPLLIPELRYAGRDKKHEHRLDFSVLNGHTFELTGFELSPASTHIRVSHMQDKTQKAVNEQLAADWNKEIRKRNDYFDKFGIPIVTFADAELVDLDKCFDKIRNVLEQRSEQRVTVAAALKALNDSRADKSSASNRVMPLRIF
jgi:hypothetical protein